MASILRQVQDQVAAQLRESEALSACPVYAEDQKDLEFQIKNALGRQGLVLVVATPKATYMGKLDDTSLAWQLDELEIDAVENPPVNRGRKEFVTGQEAAMKAFEILCPVEGDAEGQICPVRYEQGQDQGLLVSRAVFKCLVTSDEQPGPEPTPQIKKWFVKLLDEAPADGTPLQDGWMWQTDGGFVVVKDGAAQALGGVSEDGVSAMISSAVSGYLPLSGGTVSGKTQFNDIVKFNRYIEVSGTAEASQFNLVDWDEDQSVIARLLGAGTVQLEDSIGNRALLSVRDGGTVAYVEDILGQVSSFYKKSETSSAAEISAALDGKADLSALGLKQDRLTDEQMANASTKCLPLNLSGNTAISGDNYLDFRCLTRFFRPVAVNGTLDVTQLNVVNYEVDSYTALSAIDEDTIGFAGGFNRQYVAVLNIKNGTIAYISDISATYEARISALEARIAALEGA